ncbi:MAG TPA: hypothetical protein VF175_09395, partial [Lacipirellula sp.]
LRTQGPAGLEIALAEYDMLSRKTLSCFTPDSREPSSAGQQATKRRQLQASIEQARQRVDAVAAQRDAHISRLYWYSDLEQAKRIADAAGKPILSLRMLGKLTDEYSCANSRFFRTALYANKEISDYLRENYVLHWQSVRPVPRVTIDFGDGRKLERTITGNSAHYVLDATGRPLDALPGLYGPKAFKDWLVRAKGLADRRALARDQEAVAALLLEYHATRLNGLDQSLGLNLKLHAPELVKNNNSAEVAAQTDAPAKPRAKLADSLSISKSAGEAPLLSVILPDDAVLEAQDDSLWRKIAAASADDARLDDASISLIRSEHPTAGEAGVRAATKRLQEDPVLRLVRSFEQSMALDTVKNELLLHRKIHEWFLSGDAPVGIDAFNEKVYAELFLTPSSDPWLGLAPADVYTALEGGGLTAAQ